MVKRSNSHVWVGLGFVLFAVAIAGALYFGMKLGGSGSATSAAAVTGARAKSDRRLGGAGQSQSGNSPDAPAKATDEPLGGSTPLTFNAIGPYVNKSAGYVCEGERWVLIGADDDVNGNHLVWQGENGDQKEFSYRWNGKSIDLIDLQTGKQTAFPMIHLNSGDWIVNGKRLEECAG